MTEKLTTSGQIAYACGTLGYSILINIISVMLIYFYVPPSNAGLINLVPMITVFGVLSLLSVIVASGRLVDAITDPLIAYWSDKSTNKKGRRIPFMKLALLPSAIFCLLIFLPIVGEESIKNYWWLALMQIGFYLSLTVYIIPYNALLPELAQSPKDKVVFATWMSVGFVLGIIISSQTPLVADIYQLFFDQLSRNLAIQLSIGSLALLAAFFLFVPIWTINEAKHCRSQAITIPMRTALKQTLKNKNFLVFIVAETMYFISLTIVVSGLLYYLTVLLGLAESLGGLVMGTMVLSSLLFYPLIQKMVNLIGTKKLIIIALSFLSVLMSGIYFMGKLPFGPKVQIFGFAILAAFPLAILGILPFAIIAEIADADGQATNQPKEAMFFAVRNLANKFGQTGGIMIFAMLTLFGKDPGDDLGLRLSGIFGFVLCAFGALIFLIYKDERKNG